MKIISELQKIKAELKRMKGRFANMGYNYEQVAQDQYKTKNKTVRQSEGMLGMFRGICVDTIDPKKENKVRFFCPLIHNPKISIKQCPFARPVSSMGGIDDSGLNWVPPAGSMLVLFFENGDRLQPFYIGTTWSRNRGPGGQDYNYPVTEYFKVYGGHRKGYLLGPNDESQVLPPWNTESYNGKDIDSEAEFFDDISAQEKITYPNIYGFKTPEKHMFKMVDGNAKCDRRWKRLEVMSGGGNWMIFKDDHLHYAGQWSNPKCEPNPGGDPSDQACSKHLPNTTDGVVGLTDFHGKPLEEGSECKGKVSSSKIIGGHPSTPDAINKFGAKFEEEEASKYANEQTGSNVFFKHENECRPYKGPGTPQNNRADLPQSGIQFLSISGHTLVMDDSVEEPRGTPTWERSIQPFDFGCNDVYLGRLYIKSATGHTFVMSDAEDKAKLRGKNNYIRLLSASGNRIELNDHTDGEGDCPGCPPNLAGEKRGIHIESTSKHKIVLCDHKNEQCPSKCRSGDGVPVNKATEGFIQIKSGYGLEFRMNDDHSQQETDEQWIQLLNPQRHNSEDTKANSAGPHVIRLQAKAGGETTKFDAGQFQGNFKKDVEGILYIRAAGTSVRETVNEDYVFVGSKSLKASKITNVSGDYINETKGHHYHHAGDKHIFHADQGIYLVSGSECRDVENNPAPCTSPILLAKGLIPASMALQVEGALCITEASISNLVFSS